MCGQGKTARRKRALPLFSLLHQSLACHSRSRSSQPRPQGFSLKKWVYKVSTEKKNWWGPHANPEAGQYSGYQVTGMRKKRALKNFHRKNWTNRSAVSLTPAPPPHPPTHMFQRAVKQACWPRGHGFQVARMIEWGQKSKPPKNPQGFQQKTQKIPGTKINPKIFPCLISELY